MAGKDGEVHHVLNFSASDQPLDLPFSDNYIWRELLEGWDLSIDNWRLVNHQVGSHWGRIFLDGGA